MILLLRTRSHRWVGTTSSEPIQDGESHGLLALLEPATASFAYLALPMPVTSRCLCSGRGAMPVQTIRSDNLDIGRPLPIHILKLAADEKCNQPLPSMLEV